MRRPERVRPLAGQVTGGMRLAHSGVMARFLVLDRDHATVDALTKLLRQDGHDVQPFTAEADASGVLSRESFDAVVMDLDMPRHCGDVVRIARECSPAACLVAITSKAVTYDERVNEGICIVVEKPIDYDRVAGALVECRVRGGRCARGGCYVKSQLERPQLTQLRHQQAEAGARSAAFLALEAGARWRFSETRAETSSPFRPPSRC